MFLGGYENEDSQSVEGPDWLVIEGLVENPLNISYAELWNFPLVSEVTMLQCVGSGAPPYGPAITYNWTGVPLFYLLNLAKVIPEGYREVVFNATDGFSSSVLLETALHPTTILALEANGTDLEQIGGFGSGYRVVLPCRWGYKWVKRIKQIIVVDYDYKGTYEQYGLSDEAIRPNCTLPSTSPPIRSFNAKEHVIQTLSNSSIELFNFDSNGRLTFHVVGPQGTTGYFYVTFPRDLLTHPYQVYVDEDPIEHDQIDAGSNVNLFFTYSHSTVVQKIIIKGGQSSVAYGSGYSRPPLLK